LIKRLSATLLLSIALPELVAAQASGTKIQSTSLVAEVSSVTARTPEGRVSRFTDSGGREFAVSHDDQGRVVSVMAVAKRHISDITSVGYGPDGNVIGAQLGNGETLFFHYASDGAVVIRSSVGETQTQKGERLQEKATRLKALLAVLRG
jgi:hypothetical protein